MRLIRLMLAIATIAIATGAARAQDDIALDLPACYERVYDARHLADHPAQHVQSMRIRFFRYPGAHTVAAVMNLRFREGSRRYREPAATYVAAFICNREGNGVMCGVPCDGGRVALRFTGRTAAEITLDASEGFAMSASCPDEEHVERFNPRPDDRVFLLRRIAASCTVRDDPGR